MASPDFNFYAADVVEREQTFTAMVELLHAKDQEIAALHHQNFEQERLITALCDQLAEGRSQKLPPPLKDLIARFRTH